ncbi:MoaD/ThiS family protein [Arhodomonas sp. AD133]|uniref:MoaD/ThiS family protein n=1 Tax=Arhodomonas sp. AD133 TaxID=3415009 RepID=UPI003EBB9E4A
MEIELHGRLTEVAGCDRLMLTVDAPVRVDEALERLAAQVPALAPHLSRVACAVGDTLVPRGSVVEGDRPLVLLPPVSGG